MMHERDIDRFIPEIRPPKRRRSSLHHDMCSVRVVVYLLFALAALAITIGTMLYLGIKT